VQTLRNVVIVLGIAAGFSLLTLLGTLTASYFPHFVASDDQMGTLALLHILSAVPPIVAAATLGAVAAVVFPDCHHRAWSSAALALLITMHLSSYRGFWRRASLQTEDVIGLMLSIGVLAVGYLAAYTGSCRRKHARNVAG
jgi:hypothetical protein